MKLIIISILLIISIALTSATDPAYAQSNTTNGDYNGNILNRINRGWSISFSGNNAIFTSIILKDGSLAEFPFADFGHRTKLVQSSGNHSADEKIRIRIDNLSFEALPSDLEINKLLVFITVKPTGEVIVEDLLTQSEMPDRTAHGTISPYAVKAQVKPRTIPERRPSHRGNLSHSARLRAMTPRNFPILSVARPTSKQQPAPIAITPLNVIKAHVAPPPPRQALVSTPPITIVDNTAMQPSNPIGKPAPTGLDACACDILSESGNMNNEETIKSLNSYCRELISRLATHWLASPPSSSMVLEITVRRYPPSIPQLVSIVRGSGSKQIDDEARRLVENTSLPPMPTSYSLDTLSLTIPFDAVEKQVEEQKIYTNDSDSSGDRLEMLKLYWSSLTGSAITAYNQGNLKTAIRLYKQSLRVLNTYKLEFLRRAYQTLAKCYDTQSQSNKRDETLQTLATLPTDTLLPFLVPRGNSATINTSSPTIIDQLPSRFPDIAAEQLLNTSAGLNDLKIASTDDLNRAVNLLESNIRPLFQYCHHGIRECHYKMFGFAHHSHEILTCEGMHRSKFPPLSYRIPVTSPPLPIVRPKVPPPGAAASQFGTGSGAGSRISMAIGAGRAMGNIGPYRKDMIMRLALNWHSPGDEDITVLIKLAHDGSLIDTQIVQSSGYKMCDRKALDAVRATTFAPLPDWYKGDHLTFKIELSKVEALNH